MLHTGHIWERCFVIKRYTNSRVFTRWRRLVSNISERSNMWNMSADNWWITVIDVFCTFTYHTWQLLHHLYRLPYHRLHLLLLVQYFILKSILGSSANPFLHRHFPFLPDWFHGLSDHPMILLCSALDLFAWCIRLSRLLVGFRTHFKSLHFHSFINRRLMAALIVCCIQLDSSMKIPFFLLFLAILMSGENTKA